jgi:anaerobic magnesium-protoporphyrin IX monomethyl ester cyclase
VGFSRGCPFSCEFCGQWKFWKKYRMRDPRRFVDELEFLNRRYGVTHFFFADENPSHFQEQWLGILRDIVRRKLKVHLTMNLRVTDVIRDKKHLPLYKRAGVVYVDLGVESTDQDFLNDSKKRTTTDENAHAISLLRRHDILTIVNLLVGERHETRNSLSRKFRIVGEWDPDLIMPYVLVPYPWTPFYRRNRKWIRDDDYQNWNYVYPVMEMKDYDNDEFMEDILDNVFWFHTKKLLHSLLFVRDRYRRRSIKAFILRPAVHYFYQRHRFTRPLLGSLFTRQKPQINLNGKGI